MKKTIKRVTAFIAAICIIGGLTIHACNPASVSAAAPKFSKKKITLRVGKTKTLKIKNADKKVSFSISNKNARLTVKSQYRCVIKGKHAGKCILTAKCGNRKLKCRITVKEKKKIWNDNIINAAKKPMITSPIVEAKRLNNQPATNLSSINMPLSVNNLPRVSMSITSMLPCLVP